MGGQGKGGLGTSTRRQQYTCLAPTCMNEVGRKVVCSDVRDVPDTSSLPSKVRTMSRDEQHSAGRFFAPPYHAPCPWSTPAFVDGHAAMPALGNEHGLEAWRLLQIQLQLLLMKQWSYNQPFVPVGPWPAPRLEPLVAHHGPQEGIPCPPPVPQDVGATLEAMHASSMSVITSASPEASHTGWSDSGAEEQLVAFAVYILDSPMFNPYGGSAPIERVQNICRNKLPEVYEQVTMLAYWTGVCTWMLHEHFASCAFAGGGNEAQLLAEFHGTA